MSSDHPSLPSDLGKYPSAPAGILDEDTGTTITTQPVPVWDQTSRSRVLKAAVTAMTAFARHDRGYDTWWDRLSPLLTQQAQQDYAYVDPANVPAHRVMGTARLVDDTSTYVARVEVPTDVGAYTLVLARQDAKSPWLTSRLSPPASAH